MFLRAWKGKEGAGIEAATEITAERAGLELAAAHGDKAVEKLKAEKTLETRFAVYTFVDKAPTA